jgi:hypothetical protein
MQIIVNDEGKRGKITGFVASNLRQQNATEWNKCVTIQ